MHVFKRKLLTAAMMSALLGMPLTAGAVAFVQCPGDVNGDAIPESNAPDFDPNVRCMHVVASDGFADMADDDGREIYIFGFADHTGVSEDNALLEGILGANWPAPTIALREGQQFYLTLSNSGTINRPDLFDPHTIHFHGYPNASTVFDGVPDASIAINQGNSLTYYYNIAVPGTYMWHCHVEATEHMQLGMLGNLFVEAGQSFRAAGAFPDQINTGDIDEPPYGNWPTLADGDVDLNENGIFDEGDHMHCAYNDTEDNDPNNDGATCADIQVPLQLGSFDPVFHDASLNVQPLPFNNMVDTYAMINGRGYPDTVNPNALPPTENSGANGDKQVNTHAQRVSSLVEANQGDRILLRLSSLSVTDYFTVTALGLPMQVVGQGANHLHNGDEALYYNTASVTLGGGESADVIIDTTGIPAGTYFLYTTNLNYLSNDQEDFGGMMTEIRIN